MQWTEKMAGEKPEAPRKRGKRFDRALKQVAVLGVSGAEVRTEPELWFLQKPDILFPRGSHIPSFTPLRELIEDRLLAVEHFSSSLREPARKRMKRLYRNLEAAYEKWQASGGKKKQWAAGSRPPMLLIVSTAKPSAFIREGLLAPDPDILGLFRGLGEYSELRYLWLYGLDPEERGWDLLRWGFPPHAKSTVDRMRIFQESNVPIAQKQQLWSLLMSRHYGIDIGPDENPYDVVLEKGLQQGLEKGIKKGLEKGLEKGIEKGLRREFESLLIVARKVLTDEELLPFRDQRVSIELVEKLRERLVDRLDS